MGYFRKLFWMEINFDEKIVWLRKWTDWQHHGVIILSRLGLIYVCIFAMWLYDSRVLPSTQAWRVTGYQLIAAISSTFSRLLFFIRTAMFYHNDFVQGGSLYIILCTTEQIGDCFK